MKIRNLKKSYLLIVAAFMVGFTGITAMAAQTENGRRASNIQSKGNFDYENGKVVICSSDLTYLADEIDLLEDTYKTETVRALNQIGTYFRTDGTPTHNESDNNIPSSEARQLPYNLIMEGIIRSQSIPTERTYTGILPGQTTETHGNISAAIENNLTLGTAAWVDGKLIIGNGTDNNSSYTKGKKDGYDDGYSQGSKDGYDAGYAQGSKDGYDNGYAQGSKDGHDNGYNQGYEAGAAASKVFNGVAMRYRKKIGDGSAYLPLNEEPESGHYNYGATYDENTRKTVIQYPGVYSVMMADLNGYAALYVNDVQEKIVSFSSEYFTYTFKEGDTVSFTGTETGAEAYIEKISD